MEFNRSVSDWLRLSCRTLRKYHAERPADDLNSKANIEVRQHRDAVRVSKRKFLLAQITTRWGLAPSLARAACTLAQGLVTRLRPWSCAECAVFV